MVPFGAQFVRELLNVFLEASPYILLGFVVAAGVHVLLPMQTVRRLFGTGRIRPVVMASLLGIPLPLCSCSVLPTALALRKRGASRGATLSFLVSTPETGIDSIALTWGLMDPLMAVFRPFSALVTALTAGFAADAWGGPQETLPAPGEGEAPPEAKAGDTSHDHDRLTADERAAGTAGAVPFVARLRRGFRSAFVEIFDETSHWMLAGLVISAVIAVVLPAEIVTRYLSSGPVPMLLMLVIGIPLYICASASTPIAAALVLKGLSPGAALVFLLAGPATNIGSLAILSRSFGRRVMVIYLTTIAVLSVGLGLVLDALYGFSGIDPTAMIAEAEVVPLWLAIPAAIGFALLLAFSFRRVKPPAEFRAAVRGVERLLGFRFDRRFGLAVLGVVVLLAAFAATTVRVPPGSRALLTRFGMPRGEPLGEGLHFRLPPPIDRAVMVRTDETRRLEIGFRSGATDSPAPLAPGPARSTRGLEEESIFVTGDENLIATQAAVQYRVTDPVRYHWAFDDPDGTLRLETIAETLDVLASLGIDGVYTGQRAEVEDLVLDGLRRRVEALDLGVEVLRYCLRDVHAPPEVHAAFRDVASAQEDKQTAINVALRFLDESVNLARGEAARQEEEAAAAADGDVLRAEGVASSLRARAGAYQEQPTGTFTRLYLETVEEVLAGSRKIIRPGWPGSGDVDLWISNRAGGTPAPVDDIIRGSDVRRSDDEKTGSDR
ncbi:SO_0444 family Cu/Zn efflux transporter [bacterium]|nr:SO_0444 family Cu/Zn efflux transporter [bacterium]